MKTLRWTWEALALGVVSWAFLGCEAGCPSGTYENPRTGACIRPAGELDPEPDAGKRDRDQNTGTAEDGVARAGAGGRAGRAAAQRSEPGDGEGGQAADAGGGPEASAGGAGASAQAGEASPATPTGGASAGVAGAASDGVAGVGASGSAGEPATGASGSGGAAAPSAPACDATACAASGNPCAPRACDASGECVAGELAPESTRCSEANVTVGYCNAGRCERDQDVICDVGGLASTQWLFTEDYKTCQPNNCNAPVEAFENCRTAKAGHPVIWQLFDDDENAFGRDTARIMAMRKDRVCGDRNAGCAKWFGNPMVEETRSPVECMLFDDDREMGFGPDRQFLASWRGVGHPANPDGRDNASVCSPGQCRKWVGDCRVQ
ncbi:MAG: hypothetical protein ABW321_21540 [Polyangiales bacterium]